MRGVSTFVAISRLHIIAIAALGTLTFAWLFTGTRHPELAAVCAADWFIVNLLNRVVDVREDHANAILGTSFVERHRRALVALGFVTLAASLIVVHLAIPSLTWLRVAFHSLGLAYNWPLLPGRRRIKQLYFWKNTASALGFVLTVLLFPLSLIAWGTAASLLPSGISLGGIVVTSAYFVLFELSYEVIYDLRDEPGDRLAGVQTYAVVHGAEGAQRIAAALVIASVGCLLAGRSLGVIPIRIAVMAVAPLLQLAFLAWIRRHGVRANDCIRLTWLGAGLLAAYHGWIALRLPWLDA